MCMPKVTEIVLDFLLVTGLWMNGSHLLTHYLSLFVDPDI